MTEKKKEFEDRYQMENFSSTATIASVNTEINKDKDDLYNPFDHRDQTNANSDGGSLAHLLKSSLGTGILAMPSAIMNGGLLFGGIGTILIGTAFRMGPKRLRPFANFAESFVDAAISATSLSGTCVYVVFVASSIKQIADYHSGTNIDVRLYMLMLLPLVLALGQIRKLKHLIPFSVLANISIFVGFTITLYYLFQNVKPISSVNMIATLPQLPKFFATVLFSIEGIGAVMPVENGMRNPNHFLGCPSVLNIAMSVVVCLYTVIGIFGYLQFGEGTLGSITLNLETTDPLSQVVKLLIAFAILLTYGLQFHIGIEAIWESVQKRVASKYNGIAETITRILVCLITVALAIAVPRLEPFISLVGSVFLSMLGIAVPAIVETMSCWDGHLGRFKWRLWKNSILLVLSLLALVFGAWISIVDIIALYE